MSRTFFVKRRFHIGYSLLGRLIRRRVVDQHYAEGVFIIAFAVLFIGMVISNSLGWALLHPSFSAASGGQIELFYWIAQSALILLFFSLCMFGFKPALRVAYDTNLGLSIEQGDASTHIPLQKIQAATTISALRFHQHHRKYQMMQAYFVKLPQSLILLSSTNGPVALGLPQADQQELLKLLQPQTEKIVFSTLSSIV